MQTTDSSCARQRRLDDLLVRVGDGDRGAFAALYDELAHTVYAMTLSRTLEPRMSAQVTQDVFVRTWAQARSFEAAGGSAWAWVHALAHAATADRSDRSGRSGRSGRRAH